MNSRPKTDQEFLNFVYERMPQRLQIISDEREWLHVAGCLKTLDAYLQTLSPHYKGNPVPLGSFLTEIAKGHFYQAMNRADATNMIFMPVYGAFMYEFAPAHIFSVNTKVGLDTADRLTGELSAIRNKLYDSMPIGDVNPWDIVVAVKEHLARLDVFIDKKMQL